MLLAVLDQGEEAFVGALSDEVVGVRSFLEEDLHDWIQARLHDAFEADEVVDVSEATTAEYSAEHRSYSVDDHLFILVLVMLCVEVRPCQPC